MNGAAHSTGIMLERARNRCFKYSHQNDPDEGGDTKSTDYADYTDFPTVTTQQHSTQNRFKDLIKRMGLPK